MAKKHRRAKARALKGTALIISRLKKSQRDLRAQLKNLSKAHGNLLETHDNLVDRVNAV